MSAPAVALTGGELTALVSASTVRTYLIGMPVGTSFATGQINMPGGVTWPTGDLTCDGTSVNWTSAKIGMTVWVGSAVGLRDRGVYFVRKAIDATHLYIQEIGQPDSGLRTMNLRATAITDNDYVTIFESYNLHAAHSKITYSYGSSTGTFTKFSDLAYVAQNTKPDCYFQGDTHKAYRIASGASTVAGSMAITGVPHRATQTVSSYAWTVPASFTGTSGLATATASFTAPQGWHVLYCAVTLSDGTVTTAIRYVVAYTDTGTPSPTLITADVSDTRDMPGRRYSVTFADDLRSAISDEDMVMIVDEITYTGGAVASASVRFVGWLNTENATIQYGQRGTTVEVLGVGAVLGAMGADSQRLTQASSPANWQEAPSELMTGTYFMWYLLRWGVANWNALFCYYPPPSATPQLFNPWDAAKGTYLSQITTVGQRLRYALTGFDSDGDLHCHPYISLADPASRSFTQRDAITADMYSSVSYQANNRPPIRQAIAGAFYYNGTTMQAQRSVAPSLVVGQGNSEDTAQNICIDTWDNLDIFVGQYYQWLNRRILSYTFALPGNRDVYEPVHGTYITYTIDAKYSPTGMIITETGIATQVAKKRGQDGETHIDLTVEPITSGTRGKPYPYPPLQNYPYGVSGNLPFTAYLPASVNSPITVQNNYSPVTAPAAQVKFVTLARNAGSTEWRVTRIDQLSPSFTATDISPTSGQRSTLGPAIRLTRDPTAVSGYFLLCRDGIAYTANAAGRTVTWTVVTGSSTWTKTTDFTAEQGLYHAYVDGVYGALATWVAGVGWQSVNFTGTDHQVTVVPNVTVNATLVSFGLNIAQTVGSPNHSDIYNNTGGTLLISVPLTAGVQTTSWSGAATTGDVWLSAFNRASGATGLKLTITAATFSGSGSNPFGGTSAVNIADIAISNGGNIYWLSKATVSGTDYVFCNYTRNGFKTIASTQVAKYDAALNYNIQISPYNAAWIWVSAGTTASADAAIYFSSNGAVTFTAGATLNTRGGAFRLPRSLPNGGQNRQAANIVYIKGVSTNLQGVRDGYSAATISAGATDYPASPHTLNSFYLDGNYVLAGLKSRGIYKSDDGGKIWAFVATAPGTGDLYSLEVWPSNKSYVIVAGDQALAYSTDRAATYTNLWSSFSTWAVAQYGVGIAQVVLNALPVLWTVYSGPVN